MLLLIIAFIITCRAAVRQDVCQAGGRYQHATSWRGITIIPRASTGLHRPAHATSVSLRRLPRLKHFNAIQFSSLFPFSLFLLHIFTSYYLSWRGAVMPVWGVRRVYAGVPYSCNTVRVCNPCCSVTLYCVVSSSSSAGQDGDRRPTSATQVGRPSTYLLSSQDKRQEVKVCQTYRVSKYWYCNHHPFTYLVALPILVFKMCSPRLSRLVYSVCGRLF